MTNHPKKKKTSRRPIPAVYEKAGKVFFETRTVQLWGVVDDRSAKDIINKFFLLDADKSGTEISS